MASWSAVFVGDRQTLANAEMPADLAVIVTELLAHYPSDTPIAQRVHRRPKDPSRPIETAETADGIKHAVGNFEDVTIKHEGVYRVTLHGNPDDYGTIRIEIEPDFSAAIVSEQVV